MKTDIYTHPDAVTMVTPPTAGDVIRGLLRYYEGTHALNLAVNAHRRERGSKNWFAAAAELLSEIEAKK